MPDRVETFERSLEGLGVGATRADPEGFADDLAAVVEEPAVGVPLDVDGVSLADTAVELDVTPRRLQEARTGVTPAGAAIADYGSLVVQSTASGAEPVSLYPPRHVAVVAENDVVADTGEATDWLGAEFATGRNSAVLATGVSATGDMGAIVEGVHGPETVHVIIIEQ